MYNLRGAKMWRAAQYTNTWAVMTVEALMDRDGKQANKPMEKQEMLRRKSAPLINNNQNYKLSLREGHILVSLTKLLSETLIAISQKSTRPS